jgi:hypothetical protein
VPGTRRATAARIAALTKHSQTDGREATAKARSAFMERFYNEVDPDRVLSGVERERRAQIAKRLYFVRLNAASQKVRGSRSPQQAS